MADAVNAAVPALAPRRVGRTGRAVARLKDFWSGLMGFGGGLEGSRRGPFFGFSPQGHAFLMGYGDDGFQRGLSIDGYDARMIPAAYAAAMANARAVSQCYAAHKHVDGDGAISVVTTSAASRVLRQPNPTETWPQFILNMVAALQFDGNAYAVALRNARGEVDTLWRMTRGSCQPYVAEDGGVFYAMGENPLVPDGILAMTPARNVLHLRMHCPRHPLLGESPITAAAMAAGVNVALSVSQLAFFSQMRRPSGVLSTDQALTKPQMDLLRQAFDESAKLWQQGSMPILANGLKFQPMSINSQDAQLVEAQRLSIEDIARVFGVPPPVIGDLTHATLQNVESLINYWLAISLGALLENIERSLDALFGLVQPADFTELDTRALLRTDFAARVDATCKAIQGGLFTPNEGRSREGLSPVANGDKPYMQQQMVPLGWEPPPPPPPPAPAPPPPADGAAPPPPNDGPPPPDDAAANAGKVLALEALVERCLRDAMPCAAEGITP